MDPVSHLQAAGGHPNFDAAGELHDRDLYHNDERIGHHDYRVQEDYREEEHWESLRILTKNAFIHTDEKLEILLGELEELEWQIVFSESCAADHNRELHGGHRLITCLRGRHMPALAY